MHLRKLPILALLVILATSIRASEEPDILLRGILKLGDSQAFSISDSTGMESKWLKLEQNFRDYTLRSFDEETEVLTVEADDETFELSLAAATEEAGTNGTAEERLAEAKRMMDLMQFDKMMEDTMDGQMEGMADMMRQQMSQMGQPSDEDFVQFYSEAMTRMFDQIDWEPIKAGMTEAYAEIFTKSELEGMSNFYTTPAGRASLTKMPEIQQKSMQVMMPAIMKASGQFQKEISEYMQKETAPTE
jgi:uncharacterized protein